MNGRHAYLILAHKDDELLHTLLQMLDDSRNDIYLHMDKKNKQYRENALKDIVKKSNLYLLKRHTVYWGGFSSVLCEMSLFETALKNGPYDYYHLLSGQDLPIKSQDVIHEFFLNNYGKEFVGFDKDFFLDSYRVGYYYFFPSKQNSERDFIGFIYRILNRISLKIQKEIGLKRFKQFAFQKGANWVSVTHSFVQDLLASKNEIKRLFRFSFCGDELYKQTFIIHHPQYLQNLFHREFDDNMIAHQRLIDWERGTPYVWKMSDKETLLSSNLLFARKFDPSVDRQIIDLLRKHVIGN